MFATLIVMIPTPETISRLLEEQIRSAALAVASPSLSRRGKSAEWIRSVGHWLASDPIRSVVLMTTISALLISFGLFASAWPPGGGSGASALVIAQGASLVFVAIVVGLVGAPVQASRAIDWDASWIGREPGTWAGFAVLALVSILLLLIGWSEPDSTEELASIFLTAAGLSLAGLTARHIISLGDPGFQLNRRVARLTVDLIEGFEESAESASLALQAASVDKQISTSIVQAPSPAIQRLAASGLRQVSGSARAAASRGEWRLASAAHSETIGLAFHYVLKAERIPTNDDALQVLRQETDDLHSMADGPAGRWFSFDLISNLSLFVSQLILLQRSVSDHETFDAHGSVFISTLDDMMKRRIADTRSGDVHEGLIGIARMADAEVEVGHAWGAAYLAKYLCPYATLGAVTGRADMGPPAWSHLLRLLVRISGMPTSKGSQQAFSALGDDISDALRSIPQLPNVQLSGFDPVVGYTLSTSTLATAVYELWSADDSLIEEVREFSFRVMHELSRMLLATDDDHTRFARSSNVTEATYHILAAATRRTGSEPSPAVLGTIVATVGSSLSHLRNLLFDHDNQTFRDDLDTRTTLRAYFSGWQLALYAVRDQETPVQGLLDELGPFLVCLDAVGPDMHELSQLRDGLRLLGSWLEREGYDDAAQEVIDVLTHLPEPAPAGFLGLGGHPLWGPFTDEYSIYRGSLMSPFFERVSAYFDGGDPDDGAEDEEE